MFIIVEMNSLTTNLHEVFKVCSIRIYFFGCGDQFSNVVVVAAPSQCSDSVSQRQAAPSQCSDSVSQRQNVGKIRICGYLARWGQGQ